MYLSKTDLKKALGISGSTVTARVNEMQKSHRYADTDIIRDGNLLWVDWYAYIDWMATRRKIQRGPVAPFNRQRAEREIPAPVIT